MLHGGSPCRPAVSGGGAVNLNTLGVHRHPHQWHVVFPANNCAEPAKRRVENRKGRPIAVAPDQPLAAGWHELAMLAKHRTVRTKKQRSAIQRAVFSLDYTD